MIALLTILTSIISGACFFVVYEYGRRMGIKEAEDKFAKEQVVEINRKNQRAYKKQIDFANFNG